MTKEETQMVSTYPSHPSLAENGQGKKIAEKEIMDTFPLGLYVQKEFRFEI